MQLCKHRIWVTFTIYMKRRKTDSISDNRDMTEHARSNTGRDTMENRAFGDLNHGATEQ